MHPAFARTDHRPWPLPSTRWTWRQRWCDLLFAHWPIPASVLRPFVPPALEMDEHGGTSWVGVVPFRMEGVMKRPLPDVPFVSAFPELNLRLYVHRDGKPGVWFISLDAANALAVWAARRFFHLPYFRAAMNVQTGDNEVRYTSKRLGEREPVVFRAAYRPSSDTYAAERGSLEHFLTERYCLYAQRPDGALFRSEVHHLPWPLQRATATIDENTLARAQGIELDGPPALLHFSRRLDVVVYPALRVA